jgi:DNA-binding transcriptional regulator YhcF (GntR family)
MVAGIDDASSSEKVARYRLMIDNVQTWHQDRPIYRQLMEQIVARILDNTYREGEMLPSVRQLASDFVVNPLTAARAYRELDEARAAPLPARRMAGGPRSDQGARPRPERAAQKSRALSAD